jgi:hypothetical protein
MPTPPSHNSSVQLIPGKRRDGQFTVQASLAKLKENVPRSFYTPHLEHITDGKSVGEAIRLTGPDLIYVRFPDNPSGHPVSFTLPRKFLIPVTCRPLARAQSCRGMGLGGTSTSGTIGGTSLIGGTSMPVNYGHSIGASSMPATFGMTLPNGLGGSSQLHCSHNNKDAHDPVDVGHQLGEKGEPALCVVCGMWDERPHGQKRRSGHKCQGCIGQKSLDRLRKEFQRLLESESNDMDDLELAT